MFKKIKEFLIKDINKDQFYFLGVFNGQTFWVKKGSVFIYKDEVKELLHFETLTKYLTIAGKFLYLENVTTRTERRFVNLKTLEVTELTQDIEVYSGNEDFCIGIDQITKNTVALKLNGFNITWQKKSMFFFKQFKEYTFSWSLDEVTFYDNNTGIEIWQFSSFSQFDYEVKAFIDEPSEQHKAELQRILGIYNDILWLTLNSGRLLGLSMADGNLLHNITHPNFYPNGFKTKNYSESRFYGSYTYLDEEGEVLFGLLREHYWEIDLKDPDETFIFYSFKESAEKFGIEADGNISFPFTRDEIFFNSRYPEKNGIGVFDRHKKEIVWAVPVERSSRGFPAIKKIDYADNKFYVITDNGNLIIYERQ